jgi:hypothetical protein
MGFRHRECLPHGHRFGSIGVIGTSVLYPSVNLHSDRSQDLFQMVKYTTAASSDPETFELHPQAGIPETNDESSYEPLLPRYERHNPSSSPSPHKAHQMNKQRRRLLPALRCMLVTLMIVAPSLGLAACYFGKGFMGRLRGWDRWEDVPDGVKGWLEGLEGLVPHSGVADLGAFPTE